MDPALEKILGNVEKVRAIPGTRPGETEIVRYVQLPNNARPEKEYERVICQVQPLIAKRGGVMLDNASIRTPDGNRFYCLYLNLDISGWRKQIEEGAAMLGLLSGYVVADMLHLSDGRTYLLKDCEITLE